MKGDKPGFAIVRVDGLGREAEEQVTVKHVVWDEALAESEVRRLNELNADKGSTYFWQYTQVAPPNVADEDGSPPAPPPPTPGIGSPETRGSRGREHA